MDNVLGKAADRVSADLEGKWIELGEVSGETKGTPMGFRLDPGGGWQF